ncbi:neutral zinc metallopeptidase [Lentilitoribacter sp. EG35]|uniref:KPN_02809 family neutral zinc metallopeptidase n=1 Tax=Lentilitoribacter sp. EG35 TaxID=3234192 RepID=UPI00346001BA
MRWKGRRQSSNFEDRTNQSSGRGSRSPFGRGGIRLPSRGKMGGRGGMSFKSMLLLGVIFLGLWAFGIVSPADILSNMGGESASNFETTQSQSSTAEQDEMTQFVRTVLAETEDVWNGIMKSEGVDYPEPTLVSFRGRVNSACGTASSATGPFYCPGDSQVYIDLSFYDELARKFGAAGDFAQAYVLAHEVGHHVQNVIGVLPKFNQMRRSMSKVEENRMSVRVELQADCFAGIWAHFTAQKGLLERGDIEEALNAANQIGDDTLQKRSQGFVVPESFNHGTSEQRKNWFTRGFETGKLASCDTFNTNI